MLYPLVENSVMLVEKGMEGATGNIYTGLLEFEDMAFVLHVLEQDELFADIGANVGVYSVLAAKNAGANVVAVEPIPATFNRLTNNIFLNKITEKVTLLPIGVGDVNTALSFTNTMDSINHVVASTDTFAEGGVIKVSVKKLDDVFAEKTPVLMKMDIEGYEWPALNGASNLLASDDLKAIIIELNGCGNAFGFSDDRVHDFLCSFSFSPYAYNPFSRTFTKLEHYGKHNTIYIKDLDWASKRTTAARKYSILNQLV